MLLSVAFSAAMAMANKHRCVVTGSLYLSLKPKFETMVRNQSFIATAKTCFSTSSD